MYFQMPGKKTFAGRNYDQIEDSNEFTQTFEMFLHCAIIHCVKMLTFAKHIDYSFHMRMQGSSCSSQANRSYD